MSGDRDGVGVLAPWVEDAAHAREVRARRHELAAHLIRHGLDELPHVKVPGLGWCVSTCTRLGAIESVTSLRSEQDFRESCALAGFDPDAEVALVKARVAGIAEDPASRSAAANATPTLRDLGRLLEAFGAIRFQEFCEVLRRTIGASEDYARGCWSSFREHPLGYCRSRNPSEQGEGLLALALEKLRLADESGRAIGCPGEGRCHHRDMHCRSCGDVAKICDREGCAIHRAITDERLARAVLEEFEPRAGDTTRRRMLREHVVRSLMLALGTHAHLDPARVEEVLDAALADGKLQAATRPGWAEKGWLEAPLAPQKPGEHSKQCQVSVEFWNDRPVCDPDVCAFVPEDGFDEKVRRELEEYAGNYASTLEIAATLKVPRSAVVAACQRIGAPGADSLGWAAPVDDEGEEG